MGSFTQFHKRSIEDRDNFWAEQAKTVDWQIQPQQICDYSNPPFAKWFVGGTTNLCHNAIDRHLKDRGDQAALIFVSTETDQEKTYTYKDLHAEVQRMAAILRDFGVVKGDRVLIYMPMIAEASFAMLACARIGAIHSVVFGGFASHSLATRIEDATPKVIISADAGSRGGKVVAYKPLLDEAIGLSSHKPKGVQRDTGGYAVALASSIPNIFQGKPGETFFCTSDIGWVVGHSYIIYGPLIGGMATILYEGLPIRPDGGIWWSLVEKYKVSVMFSAPTAIRVLKKQDPALLTKYNLKSLKALFLAGEPLDEPTAKWISEGLGGTPIIDNYWQTETGWPILTICNGVEKAPSKFGSPGKAVYGYDVKLVDDQTGEELTGANQKGVLTIEGPLPPGNLQTVWGDDARFVNTYWKTVPNKMVYSTFDWAVRDEDGYFFILGRTDDVINVAGHRLGTREIEESISSHPNIAEVAVVGVADQLKGQVAMAFAIAKDASALGDAAARLKLEGEVMKVVDNQLGAVARPARVFFVSALPKTRSGKLLRRAIQAVGEKRDPGDLTTMDDPLALKQIQDVLA